MSDFSTPGSLRRYCHVHGVGAHPPLGRSAGRAHTRRVSGDGRHPAVRVVVGITDVAHVGADAQ